MADSKVHVQRSKHWEKQKRDKKGKFGEFDEKYQHEEDIEDKPYANSRPEYAEGQVETVWSRAKEKGLDNNVRDPNTGEILEWDREKSRKGQWDMGHEPGEEYWRKHEAYMDGTISKEEFLNWYTNPDNYRPEAPSPNRSRKYEERKDD